MTNSLFIRPQGSEAFPARGPRRSFGCGQRPALEEMLDEKHLPDLIGEALRNRTPQVIEDKDSFLRHAAVLIPLFQDGIDIRVLLTQRTQTVEAHKGQISFPGGRIDEKDRSLLDTALREAYEEVGIHQKDVIVLGRTDDMRTVASNYIVHPFVGLIPSSYSYVISKDEVERLITVPLRVFFESGSVMPVSYEGRVYESLAYTYDGDVIWGATARIMNNLVRIVKEKL
jgi:8-oxo-dGTP pyrophosphatase MutT (NUDIX family)